MPIFGYLPTQIPTTTLTIGQYLPVSRYRLTENGQLQSITAYLNVTTTVLAKCVVYSHVSDTNLPLVAETAELSISASGWYTFNFPTPIPASLGDYWLGLFTQAYRGTTYPYTTTGASGPAIQSGWEEAVVYPTTPTNLYGTNWRVNGAAGASNTTSYLIYCTYTTVAPVTYTLTISAQADGTTDPVPGSYVYSQGQTVLVTAFPNSGYNFDHWELDGVNMGIINPISITMNADHSLLAMFSIIPPPPTFNLTINPPTGGTGTLNPVQGTYSYAQGTIVRVTCTPDAAYQFIQWDLDGIFNSGTTSGNSNYIDVTMDADHVLTPMLWSTPIIETTLFTIDLDPGSYSVQIEPTNFLRWSDGITNNPRTVVITAGATVTLVGEYLSYLLTINADPNGQTSPVAGQYIYEINQTVQVTATPASGYTFDYWVLDGVNVGSSNPINILMDANHILTPVFSIIPPVNYTLTIPIPSNGTTNSNYPPGIYTITAGTNVSISAIPDMGYVFSNWLLDGINIGSANPITLTMDANHTLQAVFQLVPVTFTLTISATTGGTTNPLPNTYVLSQGTVQLVTALPDTDYRFVNWLFDSVSSTTNPMSVTIISNVTLQAIFEYVPPPPLKATITGIIRDAVSATPIADATVTCNGYAMLTGIDGTYQFIDIPAQSYTLTVRVNLYLTQTIIVDASSGGVFTQDVNMQVSKPLCFIATAAYGTVFAQELVTLRNFRDHFMLKNNMGKLLVSAYYLIGKQLARIIHHSEKLRFAVRTILQPVVNKLKRNK